MNNTIIDWVRHAESCSNLLEYDSTDEYRNKQDFNQFIKRLNDDANEEMDDTSLPFRNYIHDYANKKLNKNKSKRASFVRDFMLKSDWLFHPP